MDNLLISSIIGTLTGIIGTGLGGAVAFFLNKPTKRLLSSLISFSAGLMIAVVCFDLLPNSFAIGGLLYGMLGVISGILMIIVCQDFISKFTEKKSIKKKSTERKSTDKKNIERKNIVRKNTERESTVRKSTEKKRTIGNYGKSYGQRGMSDKSKNYMQTGILLGVGIALHNFPEGLAIGSGFTAVTSYGLGLSFLIALHDIPEGMAMATPMRMGGMGKLSVFAASLLAGVPTGIGALVGYLLGGISPVFISICLGFAGGAMLYIICGELIPEYRDLHKGRISSVGFVAGVIIGILVSSVL